MQPPGATATVNVSRHAVQRFIERFDATLSPREAYDLLVLAYQESVRPPLWLRQYPRFRKCERGHYYRYHASAGLVLLMRQDGRGPWIMTCWLMEQY